MELQVEAPDCPSNMQTNCSTVINLSITALLSLDEADVSDVPLDELFLQTCTDLDENDPRQMVLPNERLSDRLRSSILIISL